MHRRRAYKFVMIVTFTWYERIWGKKIISFPLPSQQVGEHAALFRLREYRIKEPKYWSGFFTFKRHFQVFADGVYSETCSHGQSWHAADEWLGQVQKGELFF